ncbi:MAG TPA: hypothetical protein VG099_18695 [Gemmataceae bacterium]|jgi:hypothetical protein|nr:hypothetical protein [Gemmataceae bacterium]
MKTLRQRLVLSHAVLGLLLAAATGCQTNIAGMTLPSGHYLNHPPQYFTPSPAFPLQRELAGMEAQGAGGLPAPGAPPLPPPAAVIPPPPIPGAIPVNPLPGPNP